MLHYDRIDIFEGIDINRKSALKECEICHCRYFSDNGFKSQRFICHGCLHVLMIPIKLNNIAISNINSVHCHYIINGISKSYALNLL